MTDRFPIDNLEFVSHGLSGTYPRRDQKPGFDLDL